MESRKRPLSELGQQNASNPADILAQVQKLMKQLPPGAVTLNPDLVRPPRESKAEQNVLVAASPSPKRRRLDKPPTGQSQSGSSSRPFSRPAASRGVVKPEFKHHTPAASTAAAASTGFFAEGDAELAAGPSNFANRDDSLAVVESLQRGPLEHDAPPGDRSFNTVEPYSGIRLSSRKIPYDDEQEFMRARYYVSPSQLYSLVRPARYGTGYDIPVDGDWVTIAVVAERSQVLSSRPAEEKDDDRLDVKSDDEDQKKKGGFKKKPPPTRVGRKYVKLTLVDFGQRGSASGGTAGDALLTLTLWEADTSSQPAKNPDGSSAGATVYRGGSGGAFEEMLSKLREKSVIAILNPRLSKPSAGRKQPGTNVAHPMANVLGVTPRTPDCIQILGYAKDLGMCTVKQRNGSVCGGWYDNRKSEVCEFHLLQAVQSKKAARPEFSASTSGISVGRPGTKATKSKYDATKKFGLLPAASSGPRSNGNGGTFTMLEGGSSKVADRSARSNSTQGHGRDALEQADEQLLRKLLRKSGGTDAAKAVTSARRHVKAKGRSNDDSADLDSEEEEDDEDSKRRAAVKRDVYNAEMMKKLGFDPTLRPGEAVKAKLPDISAFILQNQKKREFNLGPRPGPRIKSGVKVPEGKGFQRASRPTPIESEQHDMEPSPEDPEVEESDDEDILRRPDRHTSTHEVDESDSDLEIEPAPATA